MIADKLKKVKDSLAAGVELVAVIKYHPIESVQEAYDAGQRVFGESREQELRVKHEALPSDIRWHFIGHLQTNKVKYIAPYIAMIEAVDSLKLLQEINRQAEKNNRVIDVLLELHLAQESTKSGMLPEECFQMLQQGEWRSFKNVRIRGIMMMASNTDNGEQIKQEFTRARDCFESMKQQFFADDDSFNVKSYGMSGDYLMAQECGSNHVRVGSMIFS